MTKMVVPANARQASIRATVIRADGRVEDLAWTARGAVELKVDIDAARRLVVTAP